MEQRSSHLSDKQAVVIRNVAWHRQSVNTANIIGALFNLKNNSRQIRASEYKKNKKRSDPSSAAAITTALEYTRRLSVLGESSLGRSDERRGSLAKKLRPEEK
jgi:hypothetical protein